MALFSRIIKRLGVSKKPRAVAIARTRLMRFEPLEDRRLLAAAPENFTVTNRPETKVGLEWDLSEDPSVDKYEVQVSINGIDNWRPFFSTFFSTFDHTAIGVIEAACDPDPEVPCYLFQPDVYRSYYYRIQSLPVGAGGEEWSTAVVFPAAPPEDNAVKVSAAVLPGVEMITLRWPQEPKFDNATYTISRKAKDDLTWTQLVSGDTGSDWIDFDVEQGKAYEYEVKRFSTNGNGNGYVYAGLELALEDDDSTVESPGTVILIVDNTQAAALTMELDRLRSDLFAEGWDVIRHDVAPHDETGDFVSVANRDAAITVRNLIKTDYTTQADVKAVFLIGHIPVPMSGYNCPDGHGYRPFPTDAFYGEMDGVVDLDNTPGGDWTDATNIPFAPCLQNVAEVRNNQNDGAFDQKTVPTDGDGKPVELMVGRVDMHDLPNFQQYSPGLTEAQLETELLRRYLDKDHVFRSGQVAVERGALIRDQFAKTNSSTGAWQTMSGLFGPAANPTPEVPDNIDVADWPEPTWPLAVGLRSLRRAGIRSWATVSWGISA